MAVTSVPSPAPPRVLMVVRLFYPWVGGSERQALTLARALAGLGADVRLVTGRWFRGTPRRETVGGVEVFRNHALWECFGIKGLRKFGGYCYVATLGWHLWRWRDTFDAVHVHGLGYHTFAAVVVAHRLGKPVLCKLANSGPASDITRMREGRQLALSKWMLPAALRCDGFVALNPQITAELLAAGVPGQRIVELPNGVEVSRAPRHEYRLRRPPCLVYAGRLHEQKGLDTLLAAVASLVRQGRWHDVVLRLVGNGPARAELERLAARLGLGDRVVFAGQRDHVTPLLERADAFVLPSRAEGLSNALLEAMALGLPVVASDIPANRNVVRHERNGLLSAAGDPEALAAALGRVLGDAALRRALGTAAADDVRRRYGIADLAARYLDLYASVVAAGTAPAPPVETLEGQP